MSCDIAELKEKIAQDTICVSQMVRQLDDMAKIRLSQKQSSSSDDNLELESLASSSQANGTSIPDFVSDGWQCIRNSVVFFDDLF